MRSIKFLTFFVFLMSLFSCDTFNRMQLFSAACKGGEDCERFKKSLRKWKEDLKTRPNYEQLISEEGVDENKNGLRDDVEIYIDDHLEALKGRHWMAKHPFKMYGAIIESYSKVKPTKFSLNNFRKDYNNQLNCSSIISRVEGLIGNTSIYINAKIRFLLLNNHNYKVTFDNGYLEYFGQSRRLTTVEQVIFAEKTCNISFKRMGQYKNKIFYRNGKNSKRGLYIDLLHFEKRNGKKFRSVYEEYLN